MFGNKKLKQKIENLEKELASAKRDIRILWDVCEPQINAKLEQGMQEVVTALAKIFNVNLESSKGQKKQKSATIGKKEDEKQDVVADKGKEKDKNPKIVVGKKINNRKERVSKLKTYYNKANLNLSVKDFKGCDYIGEKDVATLLYLFDRYKYVHEIEKHIDLKRCTLERYSRALEKKNYLIYKNGMGRVANGCLIYNTEV